MMSGRSTVLLLSLLGAAAASLLSLTYQDVSLRSVECPPSVPGDPSCFGMYDDSLMDFINDILAHIEDGNGSLGLPPLDPLVIPNLDLNLATSFINVTGNLSLVAEGLKDLEVPFAHFCIAGFQIFLNATLPKIQVNGTYAIDGWLGGDLLYVMGDGPWSLEVEGINIYVNVGLKSNTEENHMYVSHLELGLDLSKIVVGIDGLYHDEDLSDVLTEVLNIALPQLLVIYRQPVTCFATDAIAGLLDQRLLNVTMGDLTCLVANFGCPRTQ